MIEQHDVVIHRWPGRGRLPEEDLSALLAAYHLQTQEEKGQSAATVGDLPHRYRAEVENPRNAFAGDVVLVAEGADGTVGCLVVTTPAKDWIEVKRLWTAPAARGRGVASALLGAAVRHAAENGVATVRLSVWQWRTRAIALYERLGFVVTTQWDDRDQLVCMERVVQAAPSQPTSRSLPS
ncbi:GNAT family N-acetyltransferase [Streptomyces sp. NPDC054887]